MNVHDIGHSSKIYYEDQKQLEGFFSALLAFQKECPPLIKDSTNPFFNSKYMDLASLIKVATPVLLANGLTVIQFPENIHETSPKTTSKAVREEKTGVVKDDQNSNISPDKYILSLTTMVSHVNGAFLVTTMDLPIPPESLDPQKAGSAITYARRYAYAAVLGVTADDDDDGNSASLSGGKAKKDTKTKEPNKEALKTAIIDLIGLEAAVELAQNRGFDFHGMDGHMLEKMLTHVQSHMGASDVPRRS